jgi:hypothetical protein
MCSAPPAQGASRAYLSHARRQAFGPTPVDKEKAAPKQPHGGSALLPRRGRADEHLGMRADLIHQNAEHA